MKTDVVIIGGGPGGAAAAMFLVKEGIKPLIVEMETFPRFHIGESLTGDAGQVLRELGLEQEMRRRKHPTKQGGKVFGPGGKNSFWVPVAGRDENWQLFTWDTWQVRRSDFDTMMLNEAIARGATLIRGRAIRPIVGDDGSVRGVTVATADGGTLEIRSEVLLDCSGQATWLANLGGITGPRYLGAYDRQIAFFSHVVGAVRDDGGTPDTHPDNTLIFYQQKYHWSWFIPLDHEIVSVGVVVPAAYFLGKKESKRDFLVRELHELNPAMKQRIPEVKLAHDVHVIPNYSYQVKEFTGKGFICIGDAHRFVDPIFSFGLGVTLREAQFAAPLVRQYLEGHNRDKTNPFEDYQLFCEKGIDILEDTLDMFWEHPFAFGACVHYRYTDSMTDLFAGRIYDHQPSTPVLSFRKILSRLEERERSYVAGDIYSIPIGSRFHPERAPIWEINAAVETTEKWLGPR
ncbi:MAG: NAD(P)/FAD-dependent oxidoreductase [bacterium]